MGRGSYYRWNAKTATGDLLSFSVKDLKRLRFMPGYSHTMTWKSRGQETGSIGLDLGHDAITVHYKSTPHGGAPISVRVVIPFAFTPCHYGGQRRWFMCSCSRSVTRLFIKGQRVACRHCLNLAYSSQREDVLDRLSRKIDKKQSALKNERHRPKGMHQRTFWKKQDEIYRLEDQKWKTFESEYARRFPGLPF